MIKGAQRIEWAMDDGFIVRQEYWKGKKMTIHTTHNGVGMETDMMFVGGEIDMEAHARAITANFIHSLDALQLRMILK